MDARDTGELLKKIARSAALAGLDLSAAFPVAEYNRSVPEVYSLPTFGREGPFGIVLGNSRAFWPKFLEAVRESEALRESEHPLNAYVTAAIGRLVQALPLACEVRWAHSSEPSPVAMQRASMIAGLAHTSPSYLSIHPEHGPWIGLRAVLVLDADRVSGDPVQAPDPCTPCPKPCLEALDRCCGRIEECSGRKEGVEPLEALARGAGRMSPGPVFPLPGRTVRVPLPVGP